jgi:hypothetical protein
LSSGFCQDFIVSCHFQILMAGDDTLVWAEVDLQDKRVVADALHTQQALDVQY